jgi:O-acetyl-ADP-ribose deacetylase
MTSGVGTRMRVLEGDITRLCVDAVVNAANESLLGGGGIDGAIHRAAGPDLLAECRTLGGCPTGEARITGGYLLPARDVIHTVGPVWDGGVSGEPELLRSCYLASLRLAAERQLATVAFPCISTGVFGYPKAEGCAVAVTTNPSSDDAAFHIQKAMGFTPLFKDELKLDLKEYVPLEYLVRSSALLTTRSFHSASIRGLMCHAVRQLPSQSPGISGARIPFRRPSRASERMAFNSWKMKEVYGAEWLWTRPMV